MQVSINTAVFLTDLQAGKSQFECLKTLVGKPIDNVEIRGEFLAEETQAQELAKIETLCATQNWGLYLSVPEQLFTEGSLNSQLQDYLDLATKYHLKGLKMGLGDARHFSLNTVGQLHAMLAAFPGQLTIENQPNEFGTLPEFEVCAKALLEAVPKLGYTFDSGNWYWTGTEPELAFKTLKNAITVFHLKDISNHDTVMLGDGDTKWAQMVQALRPNIPVFLEYAITTNAFDDEIAKVAAVLKKRKNI